MKLRYSDLSPFARKVRVFAIELGIEQQIELQYCDVWSTDSDIGEDNPLGQVPVLLTEDGVFAGSQLICEYLDSLHDGDPLIPTTGPRRWQTLQLAAFADGVMEAAVACVTERIRRPEPVVWEGWVDRQKQKIRRTLAILEQHPDLPVESVDTAAINLACALAYLDIRLPELDWRGSHSRLAGWFEPFNNRPSMQATQPSLPPHR